MWKLMKLCQNYVENLTKWNFWKIYMECLVKCEDHLKSKFPYFFLGVSRTYQFEIAGRYNFWVSGNTVKIMRQSRHKNVQSAVLKMKLPLRVVALARCMRLFIFYHPNKSAVEIHREVCSLHHHIICTDIQLPYTKHTSSWITTTDLFWVFKKKNNLAHIERHNYVHRQLHFKTAVCTFSWSDCCTNFTVLPETQKLYIPSISYWSVHKTPRKKMGKLTFETTIVYL